MCRRMGVGGGARRTDFETLNAFLQFSRSRIASVGI